MSVYTSTFNCNASLVQGENPLPIFRDRNTNFTVVNSKEVPSEYSELLGFECGKRVFPYKKQDQYDNDCKSEKLKSIILENEYLKATFLPTLGARLISLYDKVENKELLFANKNIQMRNLAIRDAWFSGGIEWNIGQYGHSLTTSDNVFASIQKDEDDNQFLRIFEFEKMHEIYWHIDFHLPKNSPLLFAKASIFNFKNEDTSLYCWTNTALEKTEYTRVFSSSRKALFLNPFLKDNKKGYDFVTIPKIDKLPNLDASYPQRFPYSNEYFFCSNHSSTPYEVTIEKDGSGFFDISTKDLGFRKMFCWGEQQGGKHWESYLAPSTKGEYFEAQAGVAPSQLHGQILKANSKFSFTQAFGSIKTNPKITQDKDYNKADCKIKEDIENIIRKLKLNLEEIDKDLEKKSLISPEKILNKGSGFGYLNKINTNLDLPKTFFFSKEDITEKENIYHKLIKNEEISEFDYQEKDIEFPPQSFLPLLNKNENSFFKYLCAIIKYENFDESALEDFIKLNKEKENSLICRNIAQIYLNKKEFENCYKWYEKALKLTNKKLFKFIVEEYSHLLIINKEFEKEKLLLSSIDLELFKLSDNLLLDKAILAANLQDKDTLKKCLEEREIATIREGENPFPFLYYELKALEEAEIQNVKVSPSIRLLVKNKYKVPFNLDFTVLLED